MEKTMNDVFSGKSGKVKVMYVRSDNGRNKNKHSASKGRAVTSARLSREDQAKVRNGHDHCGSGFYRSKVNYSHRPTLSRSADRSSYDPPWKTISRAPDKEPAFDNDGIQGKSFIDPEQLRRQRAEETRVYGENACQALFASRQDAIVRAWFIQSITPRFRETLRWMAANRKAYHIIDEEELVKASGTEHHGGVCFLIKKRQGLDAQTYLKTPLATDCVLALGKVSNPHNLGAIVRSCAHFGVNGVLLQDPAVLESGAAVRTAEGGAEHIKAINADNLLLVLDIFRQAGYTIVSTSRHKGTALVQAKLPAKIVLVLGQECDSLSDSTWQHGNMSISIGGTGKVDSLNVSVATGILLADWWRQNQA
jgi:TrmH RNA methyltransferase